MPSTAPSSRSPSPLTTSTAPSTPNDPSARYFILYHPADQKTLKLVPLRAGSDDKLLVFTGRGFESDILSKAAAAVGSETTFDESQWECAAVQGTSVTYWWTGGSTPAIAEGTNPTSELLKLIGNAATSDTAPSAAVLTNSSLRSIISLASQTTSLTAHVLERPSFTFPLLSQIPTSSGTANPYTLPTSSEFHDLWTAWDIVTLGMIPMNMLHQKPIELRHKPLFYIGHLPTFNAILLTNAIREPLPEPRSFAKIFERGIDPHVDDPTHCHNHSEVPEKDEDWPTLAQVLSYRDRIRDLVLRVLGELKTGQRKLTRRLARTMMMMLEHEGWHVETILYILIQRAAAGTLPPPGFSVPPWEALSAQWDNIPAPVTSTVTLGPCDLTVGHNDTESDDLLPHLETDVLDHEFGWDNESPQRVVHVGKFKVDWRPITNGEFLEFWESSNGKIDMPASWMVCDDEIQIRTFYGGVPMKFAKDWPCLTAYDDLVKFANSKGGRIPTEHELRLFLDTFQISYEEGANAGFRNWHPLPATAGGERDGGRGSNGGIWEWSSTLLDTHDGFEGTTIFPGYSSDFFDTKHQVVLGASYATIPRLSERKTVRNFYQHNYPYPWVGARVAYDV